MTATEKKRRDLEAVSRRCDKVEAVLRYLYEMVLPQSVVKHYKGGTYTVLHVARESTNRRQYTRCAPNYTVVYLSHTTGRIHTRDLMEFLQLVKVGGQRVRRFDVR